MNVILFGATGMVGQDVLRECLRSDAVARVLVVGRTPVGVRHPKLREIVRPDVSDLDGLGDELDGYHACFFCLGVSSVGMNEDAYRAVTHDLTLAVARAVSARNPGLVLTYVSGAGTDSSGQGRTMWARVKGRTENDLLALDVDGYMFRPGYIQPGPGTVSKTRLYRVVYRIVSPVAPLLRRLFPNQVTSGDRIGRAMLAVAVPGAGGRVPANRILGTREINALGGPPGPEGRDDRG
ncbi:NAD(P)H-binding protein [Streptacidiphilus sp. PB12-B1b]|uniref:NAD(P)H-binding protein n=1 Tax=Streptacidiphilus sp. PB12-B1b TaxID=2705012 RepID=UPI0015F823E6|nr:NAD(P)H-binding protein [Streptacidiphilus sp. PB12-B1b]QMU77587.1 NAD(P)H-binding protein [Streptacidiphilus sp. PB12-B1b]